MNTSQRTGRRFSLFMGMAILLVAAMPRVAQAQEPASPAVNLETVENLRLAGDLAAALEAARNLLHQELTDPQAKTWNVESLRYLVSSLEQESLLPAEEQERLTEARRLRQEHREAFEREEHDQALEIANRELAIEQEILGEQDLEVADTLCAIGLYHDRAWSDLDAGEAGYRRCLAVRREILGQDHPDTATALQLLGTLLRRRDSWEEAEALMREGLEIRQRTLGEDHPDTARSKHHLAILLVRFDRLDEAQVLYESSLAVNRKYLTYEDRLLPENLIGLGLVYRDRGRLADAEALFREALDLTRRRVGDDSWYVSWVQGYIGNCLIEQGKYQAADALLREADERLRVQDHLQLFQILGIRGKLAMATRDYAAAAEILTEALAWNRKLRGTDANYHVAGNLEKIAMARYLNHQRDEAVAMLQAAVSAYEGARLRVEKGLSRARFAYPPQVALAVLLLELDRSAEAWDAVEMAHGRLLADLVNEELPPTGEAQAPRLAQVQAALDPGSAIVGWLDYHLYDGEPRFWGYVIRDSGPVHWERLDDLGIAEQRRARREGESAGASDPTLAWPAELRDRLHAFQVSYGKAAESSLGGVAPDRQQQEEAHRLWRARLAPLERHLGGVRWIVLVPSWAMNGIPVETFLDETGRIVGERYATSYAPSATVFAWLSRERAGEGRSEMQGLLVGDPPFRAEHLAAMQLDLAGESAPPDHGVLRGVLDGDRGAMARLPRLPWSRREVEQIAVRLKNTVVLTGNEASAERLRKLEASGELAAYDILHFSTHAVVDQENPERSRLILSQIGIHGDDEGVLTASEIFEGWQVDADLVTLSACETALGENLPGEGLVGFAYPFLKAGAGSVLVSLWKVDDRATSLLMDRFYRNWLGDGGEDGRISDKATALKEAKLWLRGYTDEQGKKPFAHPYFWSAFVLVGDPGPPAEPAGI